MKLVKNYLYRYILCWRNVKMYVCVYKYCLFFMGVLGFEECGIWGGFFLVLVLFEFWKWGVLGCCGVVVIEKGL